MRVSLWALCLMSLLLTHLQAFAGVSDLSYGDLYVAQNLDANTGRFDLGLKYGLGLGSPQYTLQGGIVDLQYWVSNPLSIGLRAIRYSSSPTRLQEALSDGLRDAQIAVNWMAPTTAIEGRAGYALIQGLANLGGYKVIAYDMSVGLGAGAVQYTTGNWGPSAQIYAEQRLILSRRFGASVAYVGSWDLQPAQSAQSGQSFWLSHGAFELGAFMRL